MDIAIPPKVEFIINTLMEQGFEAFAVGGCVRDALLGRVPEDWDITTSAKPEEVKMLFRRTIDTGIQHGTVTIMIEKEGFEVTTYRIDGQYEDSRHPSSVEFTTNLVEDLRRRDFTINAMAYNPAVGLVDKFEGIEDLKRKRITCVGEPEERFEEDALRMLRAIRFAGQLGFTIDDSTKMAIIKRADTIKNISAERIRVELDKLVVSPCPDKLLLAFETGLTKFILPELDLMLATSQNNPHHMYNVGMHSIKAIEIFTKEISQSQEYREMEFDEKIRHILCWTLLLHDVGKPAVKTIDEKGIEHFYRHPEESVEQAKAVFKRLKFDNYSMELALHLIKWHDYRYELTEKAIRRAIHKIGKEEIKILFFVQYADTLAHSTYQLDEKLAKLNSARILAIQVEEKEQCTSIRDLKINGNDLIEIGFKPGKIIGDILERLLQEVLDNPELNDKEILLNRACTYKK
ncbi:CCA tRNA nucleotidyltransferase [Anaeromicropila populeti]|uniref:tRNA nucleotidyltransferase (CCA-adding enzyme) n=1 Tax=Anaeromicropila populeti TaxID=37658 RepID=A0A1I6I5W6_9FIRM|nr:CCA tRNA nucleotidyltransferase [Anaeromicropila populeti]SFR62091.1 tRNA nucleotidyltransferase (CCA-adding enzyme) [Anaeromicropila populeti]